MAYRVSNGAGTNFNTAANWDEGINSPSIHATTNITVTSGGVNSAAFTAPNLLNACTGVVVPVTAKGTAGNIIATLQEDLGAGFADVAGATATIAIANLVASTHVFFKFTTPHVFLTTTANKYRIKLNTSGASGTTSIAADAGGSNFSYLVFMNNNVVPTTGDDVFCISPNQGSAHVMSLDTSPSFGSGALTSVPAFRQWGNGLVLANNGGISYPTGTSRTLTLKGNLCNESGGKLRMGTAAAKIAAGVLARLTFDQNGATTNYGFQHLNGAETTLQGYDLTFKKSTLASGVGTAASPAIMSDSVDWTVGDELVFVPISNNAANYNESETRFIKTKNSATSYVLSTTVGGAEAALTYTHTSAVVINLTRGVLIDTTNTAYAWYADFSETTSSSNVNLDGCRLETFGGATSNKTTIIFSNATSEVCELDDVVFYRNAGSAVLLQNNGDIRTFSYLLFYDASTSALAVASLKNKTLNNVYVIKSAQSGIAFSGTANCNFNDGGVWACATGGAGQGVSGASSTKCTFTNFNFHAIRTNAFNFSTSVNMEFYDCLFGTKGYNGADINAAVDSYNIGLFDNCLFGSTTLFSSYTSMADGAEVKFHKFNQTTNDHRWYTPYGIARSTGASLADTNVRTSGTLNVRIAPENLVTGFYWDFKILARANSAIYCNGFIQKNAAFGADDVVVDLYLPGLVPAIDTPTDTYTMPDNTSFNVFNVSGDYTGSVPEYATVRISAKTTTASAYCYIADIFNGTNDITNFKTWNRGKPSEIMFEQLGDALAVWSVDTGVLTTDGTTGKKLVDDLTTAKFIALKALK